MKSAMGTLPNDQVHLTEFDSAGSDSQVRYRH